MILENDDLPVTSFAGNLCRHARARYIRRTDLHFFAIHPEQYFIERNTLARLDIQSFYFYLCSRGNSVLLTTSFDNGECRHGFSGVTLNPSIRLRINSVKESRYSSVRRDPSRCSG